MKGYDESGAQPAIGSQFLSGPFDIPTEFRRERFPYQNSLRAVGAYLDERNAHRINVIEAADGFAVRYQLAATDPDSILARLSSQELSEREQDGGGGWKRRSFPFARNTHEAATYENILRALGYELDYVEAYSLLIDELEEGIVVTYQYLKPTEGFNARKRMVILGSEALDAVLDDARSRREQRKRGVLTLLAG